MLPDRDRPVPRRAVGRRLAAVAVSCTLIAALAGDASVASGASVGSKLEDAKNRLTTLTDRIRSEEARALALQGQAAQLTTQMAAAMQKQDAIAGDLLVTQHLIDAATARAEDLQGRLNAMAQELFMQGGSQAMFIEPLLSSSSLSEFSDRLVDAEAIGQSSVDLSAQVADAKAALRVQADQLTRLASQQQALVSELDQARATKVQALDEQHQTLGELDRTKTQIVALIVNLHRQLLAQELAGIGDAFQGSGHVSYGAWAGLFLKTLGAPGCRENRVVAVAWQYAEFTQAAWNPLATTHPMPGSTEFNSVGVQNYPSLEVGLQATKATIDGGLDRYGYRAIASSLARCADAMTTARAINASSWCAGCVGGTYVTGIVPKVEANYEVYASL